MAAPLLHQHIPRHLQTTLNADRAVQILKHAFPGSGLNISSGNIAVPLPHKDIPTYLLANNKAQPWELLPTKAAALAQYPNFFNAACMFFGSINRDLVNRVPLCVVPPTKVGLDLALVLRNLGIINDFELFQRRSRLRKGDMLWPRGHQPEDMIDVKLYMETHLRLKLRWDLHKPMWASSTPKSASSPSHPLHLHDHLPLSVKSISKASQPVFMYPKQIIAKRTEMPAGIFIMYHHSLGIITDAQALLYDVPGLVIAHLGLPHSHATQISGALRLRHMREKAKELLSAGSSGSGTAPMPLKSWSMVDWVNDTVAERQATLDPSQTAGQVSEIEEDMLRRVEKMRSEVSRLDVSGSLHEELVAWEITQNSVVERIPRHVLENEQAMLLMQKSPTHGRGSVPQRQIGSRPGRGYEAQENRDGFFEKTGATGRDGMGGGVSGGRPGGGFEGSGVRGGGVRRVDSGWGEDRDSGAGQGMRRESFGERAGSRRDSERGGAEAGEERQNLSGGRDDGGRAGRGGADSGRGGPRSR